MCFALALGAGQGALGLVALVGASFAADMREIVPGDQALGRQFALLLTAAALCGWYRLSAGGSE